MTEAYRYQKVEGHVRELVDTGALSRGDKLPSLRKLSTSLGVSLSTVNQAYAELERKGVIESRPRSGYYVTARAERLPVPMTEKRSIREPRPVTRSALIGTVLEAVGTREQVPLDIIAPSPELLPGREMAKILGATAREAAGEGLVYSTIQGLPDLRNQIAFRSLENGVPASPEDLIITNGAMEALYIALRCITRPGDTVLIQSPAYFCFLQMLELLGLRVIEVDSCSKHGLSPRLVADALSKFDVSACIAAPNFSNPDGSLTPDDAKSEIVEMLAGRAIPLVEDDVSTDLHFGPDRPGTFKQFDSKGLVLLCSSFSKTICPGYRVGWLDAGRFKAKAMELKATTNVSSPMPTQVAVAEYLRRGLMPKYMRKLREAMARQMDAIHLQLVRNFPEGTRVTHPEGGAVLWLELPGDVDSVEYYLEARRAGVGIVPGRIFSTQDKYNSFIRISSDGIWTDRIGRGLEILGELAREMGR